MSIERAIERIEKWINENRGEFVSFGMNRALAILKEEAEPPCKRCKLWINEKCREYDCMYNSVQSEHSFFQPKEADETEAH